MGSKSWAYLVRVRCWRRSPVVSVNSIFTMYVCSPLSDLVWRLQTSRAEASAASAVFALEVRKPPELKIKGLPAAEPLGCRTERGISHLGVSLG